MRERESSSMETMAFRNVTFKIQIHFRAGRFLGAVLVLHTPNIKYIFEIYLGIICIAVGKNRKENIESLKWFSSTPS